MARISKLPVKRLFARGRRRRKPISIGRSRVWLVATQHLSERIAEAEESYDSAGTTEAKSLLRRSDYEVESLRWTGSSTFRREAKAGDLLIEVLTVKRGQRSVTEVYQPAPILYRQDAKRWTRFYIEVQPDESIYDWRDIKADFATLGVKDVTPNSVRELTGKALGILRLMQ